MNCLVCHQGIAINRFQELLSMCEPLICSTCKDQIINKKGPVLFENNEFIQTILTRLEKGDLVLLQIFLPYLYKEIKRQQRDLKVITFLQIPSTGPYPWGEILIDEAKGSVKNDIKLLIVDECEMTNRTIRLFN